MLAGVTHQGSPGTGEGPPTTARLRAVLARAARVEIVEGPPDQTGSADLPRLVVTGGEIADLAQVLSIVDGGTGDRCLCIGWPTILIHDPSGRLIARWSLHHQTGLRGLGDCDADLQDGPALTAWLAERGLTGSQRVQAELAVQENKAEQRRIRWIHAAPAGLSHAAADVAEAPGDDLLAWSGRLREAEKRLVTHTRRHYPDAIERIRVLLAWAGIRSRESSGGSMWYDMAVLRQLLAEDADILLAALTVRPPDPAQLDGAAELFGSLEWTNAHGRKLPEPLKSVLIGHIEAIGTDAMRFRMDHGTYGAQRSV